MASAFILSLVASFRNGRAVAFINSAAVLFVLVCFSGLEKERNKDLNKSNLESRVLIDSVSSPNITFIQPFTSLAGFNWKFGKETKKKEKDVKVISRPSLYLRYLFTK